MSSDFLNLKSQENLSILIVNQKLLLDILTELKDMMKELKDQTKELKDIEKNTGKKDKKK